MTPPSSPSSCSRIEQGANYRSQLLGDRDAFRYARAALDARLDPLG